jgi:hypothetical protein
MDQLKVLFLKYRKVVKNAAILCAVCIAIFSKTEKIRSLSLGVAAGILLIEFAESIDRAKKTDMKQLSEE